jgi:hypothetical protein
MLKMTSLPLKTKFSFPSLDTTDILFYPIVFGSSTKHTLCKLLTILVISLSGVLFFSFEKERNTELFSLDCFLYYCLSKRTERERREKKRDIASS